MFTIIMTTHNRPLLLARALRSLIEQSFQDFSVIIISDESLYLPPYNELAQLTGRYIYVLRSGVAGPAESRNLGLELVTSDYVLFLDDDDTLAPGHLAAMAAAIRPSQPTIAYCNFQVVDEDRNAVPPSVVRTYPVELGPLAVASIQVKNTIPNCALVFRRSAVATVRFDPTYIIYEDWDFLLKAAGTGPLTYVNVNSVLIHKSWAEGPANKRRGSSNNDKLVDQTLRIYRAHPASDDVRTARQKLFAASGVHLPIEAF